MSTELPLHGRGASANPANRFERLHYEADPDLEPDDRPAPATQFYKDNTRSIIATNDSPDVGFDASINPYRGCEHGCVYCLEGTTSILMTNGTTELLKDVRVGDKVYGTVRRGWYRRYVPTIVLAHWSTEKPAYRVSLEDGTTLVASGDHRFLTERGWKFVADGKVQRPHLTTNNKLMGTGAFAPVTSSKRNLEGLALKSNSRLRVVSIEPLRGQVPLFDITTGTGDFIANGVVSHNCYARPYHEYLGLSAGLDFETRIFVKEDAPALLRRELAAKKWQPRPLGLSGVTDAYQPIERKLQLTRRCLEVLADFRNPVFIVTKNHLVARDADVLARLARHQAAAVFVSLTTLDRELHAVMEPRASQPLGRLAAIEALRQAGVPVGVMVAPVIPGLNDHEIPALLNAAAKAGAMFACYTLLRLPYGVADLFGHWLTQHFPDKRERVLGRIRDLRGGSLNVSAFGVRMRGEGVLADAINQLFHVSRQRAGLERGGWNLSAAAFRRPGPVQGSLFGE